MAYDNTDKGSLFTNDKKETEKHPDYNGSINVGGKEYWLSGWKKKSEKTGKTFLSLSVREKQDAPRQSSAPTRKAKDDDFGDAPFWLTGLKADAVMKVTPLGLHLRVCEGGTPTDPYAKANAGTTQRRSEKDAPTHRRSE